MKYVSSSSIHWAYYDPPFKVGFDHPSQYKISDRLYGLRTYPDIICLSENNVRLLAERWIRYAVDRRDVVDSGISYASHRIDGPAEIYYVKR